MCGLAGGVALHRDTRPDPLLVRRMSAAVGHRGPDDEGFWVSPSGSACFGHRRLSIIDLAAGQQPWIGDDGTRGLIFNGEIYNYVEIRRRLQKQGVRFKTESDTEVLFHAVRVWGDRSVDHLVGMFAFAFWDDRQRRLLLVRDRVGKKPLYHVIVDGCLYFCSTLGGLEEVLKARPEVDLVSVFNFLNLGYVPAPDTIYEGVSKLAAASRLVVSETSPEPLTERYWDPIQPDGEPVPSAEAVDELEELLQDAVTLRLRSDVPLGVFLSGGIDSSLVAAVASRASPNRIQTFTVGFEIAEFDEAPRARRIAEHLGTEHHELRVDTDVLDLLPKLVDHFGEPFADSSSLPVWRLAEAARPHITVALMGDGGDEGFAGYDWYRTAHRLNRLADSGLGSFGPLMESAAAPFGSKALRFAHLMTATPAERFANLRCMFGPHAVSPALPTRAFLDALEPSRMAMPRLTALYEASGLRPLHAMQYVDLRTYLPGDLLPKVDVCTMAHGLEARAPLLDHRILEFAFRMPPAIHDVRRPKELLRRILSRYLPPELTRGPKKGFSVPLAHWFRSDLRPLVEALPRGELARTGWIEERSVERLVAQHMAGYRDNSLRLFHLLALDLWLNRRT